MKTKKGFTIIELLVVVAIIAILLVVILPAIQLVFFSSSKTLTAEVTEKWTDILEDKIYRIRTRDESGGVETWDSHYIHDKIQVGKWYKFVIQGNYVKDLEELPVLPVESVPQNLEQNPL